MKKTSYISTTVLPMKIVVNPIVEEAAKAHAIYPHHVKIMPTYKCSANCPTCTFANTDKSSEIDYSLLLEQTDTLIALGMKAVTLTGGGDPLSYSMIRQYIEYLYHRDIQIGLVTNGDGLGDLRESAIKMLNWCRISVGDHLSFNGRNYPATEIDNVAWSFSYLVSDNPFYDNIRSVLSYSSARGLSHVRMVNDILHGKDNLKEVENALKDLPYSKIAVYQDTSKPTRGRQRCLVSLLRPILAPDGHLYPCCGAIYARDPAPLGFTKDFDMGQNIDILYKYQKSFDGSKCTRCYEDEANTYLNVLWDYKSIDHVDFL